MTVREGREYDAIDIKFDNVGWTFHVKQPRDLLKKKKAEKKLID